MAKTPIQTRELRDDIDILQSASGSAPTGSKNYVLNTDGAVSDSDITESTAQITATRVTTDLAEESKGTGISVVATGAAVNDYVEWDTSVIDSVDGGRTGSVSVELRTNAGYVNGDMKLQAYNTDTSAVLAEENIDIGTYTLALDPALTAGENIKPRIVTNVTTTTGVTVSGVKTEPVSQTYGNLPDKSYSEANGDFTITGTHWTTSYSSIRPYQDIAGNWFLKGNFTGTLSATKTAPALTISGVTFKTTSAGEHHPVAAQISDFGVNNYAVTRATADNGLSTMTFEANGASMDFVGASFNVPLDSKPTWVDFNSVAPTISDVQYENARGRWYRSTNFSYTAGTNYPFNTNDSTTFDAPTGITNASGVFTVAAAGTYSITAVLGANPAWSLYTILQLWVNRAGAGLAKEREMNRLGVTSFELPGNATVKLAAGDSFSIRTDKSASGAIASLQTSYVEITRVSDYSARKASLPFATETEYGLVKNNPTVIKGNGTVYNVVGTYTSVLPVTAVPQGTYRVTIGSYYVYAPDNSSCYMVPQLNGGSITYGVNTWEIGNRDDGGAAFNGYNPGRTSSRIITFPTADVAGVGQNTFNLSIVITAGGIIKAPEYSLEKLENYSEITTEWD